jgi:hypothetical protein
VTCAGVDLRRKRKKSDQTKGGAELSQAKQQSVIRFGAAGLAGLILLIVGFNMYHHNSSLSSVCNSTLGQIGQSMDQQAQSMCNHVSTMEDLGIGLAVLGVVVIVQSWRLASKFRLMSGEN